MDSYTENKFDDLYDDLAEELEKIKQTQKVNHAQMMEVGLAILNSLNRIEAKLEEKK